MSEQIDCKGCGTSIRKLTCDRNDGLCFPCLRGNFTCEGCGKRVMITAGINDNDKLCVDCAQKLGGLADELGLVGDTTERDERVEETLNRNTIVVYFPMGLTDEKYALYKERLEELIDGFAEIIETTHRVKSYADYTIGNFETPRKMEAFMEKKLPEIIDGPYRMDVMFGALMQEMEAKEAKEKMLANIVGIIGVLILAVTVWVLYFW